MDLECTISILTNFEIIRDCYDWQVGVHGILCEWDDFHATFLPSVAQEQGWSKPQTISHLIRKAGFQGEITENLIASLKVTRYQSQSASATFIQYKRN